MKRIMLQVAAVASLIAITGLLIYLLYADTRQCEELGGVMIIPVFVNNTTTFVPIQYCIRFEDV